VPDVPRYSSKPTAIASCPDSRDRENLIDFFITLNIFVKIIWAGASTRALS